MIVWNTPSAIRTVGRGGENDDLMESFHETTKMTRYGMTYQLVRAHREGARPEAGYRNSFNYKLYHEHELVTLPAAEERKVDLEQAFDARRSHRHFSGVQQPLQDISNALVPGLARTRRISVDGEYDACFGTYPSGGAVYPVEHYVIPINVTDLEGVICYLDPRSADLVIIRRNISYEAVESAFTSIPGWLRQVGFIVVQTMFPERSCIKYGPRGYRLGLLEAGFAGQNILLSCGAAELGAVPWAGFLDDRLGELLGLDLLSEYVISTILIGRRK
jgi:SagB-type dehydrogenase family enzyme